MAKLGEAHIEQIKVLRAEGKKAKEIAVILATTYPGLSVNPSDVYSAFKALKAQGGDSPISHKKRAYYKKSKASPAQNVVDKTGSLAEIMKEVIDLIEEIPASYKKIFIYQRKALIKSRAEVQQILTGLADI